jgi:hypothetical protein
MRMELLDGDLPEPETLIAAALYLATHYARSGCPMLCGMMMRQLACLRYHPSDAVPPSLRETCGKLLAEWSRIGAERAAMLRADAAAGGATPGPLH